jgi:hypothetical protein
MTWAARIAGVLLLIVPAFGVAQSGGPFEITGSTIDSGGTSSSGGSFELQGSAGQPDAGVLEGPPFGVAGGFWPAGVAAPTPSPTATPVDTATSTPTETAVPTPTDTAIPTPTETNVPTPTETDVPTATATVAMTFTQTPSPTGIPATATPTTPVSGRCTGNCDGNEVVTVDEIITMVNIALGSVNLDRCVAGDASGDGVVTVDEILQAVTNALDGCPAGTT